MSAASRISDSREPPKFEVANEPQQAKDSEKNSYLFNKSVQDNLLTPADQRSVPSRRSRAERPHPPDGSIRSNQSHNYQEEPSQTELYLSRENRGIRNYSIGGEQQGQADQHLYESRRSNRDQYYDSQVSRDRTVVAEDSTSYLDGRTDMLVNSRGRRSNQHIGEQADIEARYQPEANFRLKEEPSRLDSQLQSKSQ